MAHSPIAMHHLGSGICSQRFLNTGRYLRVK